MGEIQVEEVVIKEATYEDAGDGGRQAQQDRFQAGLETHVRPGPPHLSEKECHDQQKNGQSDEAHLLGHEQVDVGHAQVQTGLWGADEPDADPGMAADQLLSCGGDMWIPLIWKPSTKC